MKTKISIPKKELVNLDFVLKNEGVYSVPECEDRIVTFSMNGEIFCSIYVFIEGEGGSGQIEALDISFSNKKSDRFEKLKEIVSIIFEKYE